MLESLREKVRALPDSPGIYVFLGPGRQVLYVGKAKSLRKRGASYTKAPGDLYDVRIATMVSEAVDLDYVVTDSEAEALLLENTWIKRRKPRYNIRLRDDKTYPYLKLTMQEEYPRLVFTRRIIDDGAEYFGPFLPAGLARKATKLVQKLFQVRVCRIEIDGKLPRPCLYHDMKRCLGPCVDGLTTHEEYLRGCEQAKLFLAGRNETLVTQLRREMNAHAEELEFERAAQIRDTITEIEALSERRKLSSERAEDVDIYGVYVAGGHAAITVLVMRGGQVLDRRELFWEGAGNVAPARLLGEVLPQIYDRTSFVPKEIHLPLPVDDDDVLEAWLSERRGTRVYVRMPSRGAKADRVALAMRNAKMSYRRRFRGVEAAYPGAEALARHLELPEPPRRVEGFDISTFQGDKTVASLVVWQEGKMKKSDYRSFNIRSVDGVDDFASMAEAVERRYRRRLQEIGEMPDLILIDGGRGQLNAALQSLSKLGVEETPIVGLAKREEEVYTPQDPEPLRLPRHDAGLQLLQQVRDEAHRFAVSRHRARRSKSALTSRFDRLRGVGPTRRKALVRAFGSYRGLEEASLHDVQKVLGERLGSSVHEQVAEHRKG
ncbi:MAG: excinuclease ABC subunit UvrC [Acidobacteriota bacterium]